MLNFYILNKCKEILYARTLVNKMLEILDPYLSCKFMNCIQISLNKVKFYYDNQNKLFYAKEVKVHYFLKNLEVFIYMPMV